MPSFIFWGERESPCECRPTCKPTQKRYFHLYGDYLLLPLLKTTPMNTRFFSLSPLYRFCRKYVVGLLLLCLVAIPARAQWSVGGKAGINWSTVRYPKKRTQRQGQLYRGRSSGSSSDLHMQYLFRPATRAALRHTRLQRQDSYLQR